MRLLLTGASGQLGSYLLRELRSSSHEVVAWSGTRTGELFGFPLVPLDLTDPDAVDEAFRAARPDGVIHTAACSSVAVCHQNPWLAQTLNVQATQQLTEQADRHQARLLFVSTDLVFEGERAPYTEEVAPMPLSVYGQSKAAAESVVLSHRQGLVVRVSLLFGPTLIGRPSFFDQQVTAVREGRPCSLFHDEWRTPLSLPTAAQGLLALAHSDLTGLLHMGGPERLSRLEMGEQLAAHLGIASPSLLAVSRTEVPAPEPRPRDVSLDSTRWRHHFPDLPWPRWQEALRLLLPSS